MYFLEDRQGFSRSHSTAIDVPSGQTQINEHRARLAIRSPAADVSAKQRLAAVVAPQSQSVLAAAARMIGWPHMNEEKAESQVNGQPQKPKRSRSRAALFAGFGALLILMAIICIDSLHTLEAFETTNTQIRQDFLYRERTLDELRARLYESRDTMLDYVLMKSEPRQREALRAQLHAIQNETKEKLEQCMSA
jgi:hypothetical protein